MSECAEKSCDTRERDRVIEKNSRDRARIFPNIPRKCYHSIGRYSAPLSLAACALSIPCIKSHIRKEMQYVSAFEK